MVPKLMREEPGEDDAILQGVSRARWDLCAVSEDRPVAGGRTRHIDGVQQNSPATDGGESVAGSEEGGVCKNEGRGEESFSEEGLRAIDIGEEEVEE